ncbi:ABC transporter permease [Scopulibacillus darangshiensis]|uniref:ABC transporter permease n=1 Tax=Scopulibacillus darangshiensis TaxID=442528 RepID=UPI0010470652|nr:autoinducer 2 import system permease LsrD [Scopulibacillus darangshiensis]
MRYLCKWELALVLLLIIELIVFGSITPGFLNVGNILYSLNDFVYIGIAAIPMTYVILTGGIDVSVGAVMGLSSITAGVIWSHGANIWIAVIIALLATVVGGLINGLIVAFTGVQPLVVTLGTMFLYSGIALVISGGSSASGYEGISGFPENFVQLANSTILGIPNPIILLIILMAFFGAVLHFTPYGRHVVLVGINIKAARYSGIRTRWTVVSTYLLAGLGGGLGGLILTSYFGSARSDLGSEAILPVITAVVLGGTSIFGGKGSVIGTAIASIVIGFSQYGLQMASMSSEQTSVVIGVLLILAVVMRQGNWREIKRRLVSKKIPDNSKRGAV